MIDLSLRLNAQQAEYAVQKYRSHRRIGVGIMMDVIVLNNPSYLSHVEGEGGI
jgi:hypothetical protein